MAPLLAAILQRVRQMEPSLADALAIDVDADGRARALRETEVRLALRRAGFAAEPGVVLPWVGEVDLLVEGVLIIEIDGYDSHRVRPQFRKDRSRDRNSLVLGLPSSRFAWEDSEPPSVVAYARKRLATLDEPLAFGDGIPEQVQVQVRLVRERAVEARCRAVGARLLRGRVRETVIWP